MTDEIKVTVCRYPDRANLVLRYIDPLTGKQKTKSAGTPDESTQSKAAGKWEDELRTGRYSPPSRLTWAEFRKRCDGREAIGHAGIDPDGLPRGPGPPRAAGGPRPRGEADGPGDEPISGGGPGGRDEGQPRWPGTSGTSRRVCDGASGKGCWRRPRQSKCPSCPRGNRWRSIGQ